MNDLIKKFKVDLNRFEPSSIDHLKRVGNGKIYGLPVTSNNMILFYNKTLFNNFGVPYPKDGMTWDEAIGLGERMTRIDSGRQYFGLSTVYSSMIKLNPFSIPITDMATDMPTINKDERWNQLFRTVFMNPKLTEAYRAANLIPGRNEFSKEQTLAMFVYTQAYPTSLKGDFDNLDWDMVSLPTFKELPGVGSQSVPVYFGITSISDHKDAAMQVIKFITSDEHMLNGVKSGRIMAVQTDEIRKALGSESTFKNKNWQATYYNKTAPLAPTTPFTNQVNAVYAKHALSVMQGKLDLNTALRTMEEEAAIAIRTYKEANKK